MRSSVTKLKRGYNINILDEAKEDIKNLGTPQQVAIKPTDFEGMKCKPSVAVGDLVKAGTILGFDKNNERVKLTSLHRAKSFQLIEVIVGSLLKL